METEDKRLAAGAQDQSRTEQSRIEVQERDARAVSRYKFPRYLLWYFDKFEVLLAVV